MVAPQLSLDEAKREARAIALAVRARCDPGLGTALAQVVIEQALPPPGAVVAGFWPLPGEIDLRPLLAGLDRRHYTLALPETTPAGRPLVFRRWRPGQALHQGRFGTRHPAGEAIVPDLVLVPLLAFDRAGRRLGYGGGYYDRTLGGLPGVIALGCAFSAQEVDAVPAGPYDARLSAVATELGVIRTS